MKFRVLYLALPKVEHKYPEIYRRHSREFPALLDLIQDESSILILNPETGNSWEYDEFFAAGDTGWVVEFTAEVLESNDPAVQWPWPCP